MPAPSGIRAVGDGAALYVRVSGLAEPGVLGRDAVVGEAADVLVGVIGFIRSPLTQAGGGTAGCLGGSEWRRGSADRGGGDCSTFSR